MDNTLSLLEPFPFATRFYWDDFELIAEFPDGRMFWFEGGMGHEMAPTEFARNRVPTELSEAEFFKRAIPRPTDEEPFAT